MSSRTVQELKEEYSDPEWRSKFVDFCDLIEILGDCIIADAYTVSDGLNGSLYLTSAGSSVRDKLTRKEGVNAKDAKLMCALTVGHEELFVDLDRIDLEQLQLAIAGELNEGRIRFPYIFGRELYDCYAALHEEGKDDLSVEETSRLLDALPPGVFQYGRFTIGPYGLQRSSTSRSMKAPRRVPAYHCSRPMCHVVHPVQLETSHVAPINRDRGKLDSVLRQSLGESSEWWQFASEVSGMKESYFGDQRAGVLLPLIGDAFSLAEKRDLLAHLLDTGKGRLRKAVEGFLVVKDASGAVESMTAAQVLQVLLFASESEIGTAVDRLVRSGAIAVPSGEVRQAVMNRSIRSGAFGLRAEVGSLGVRFVSDDPGLALLRERRLLERLYVREVDGDTEELDWQLRGIDVQDIDEKLDHFYQSSPPRAALERLVMARKANMITACEEVNIEDGADMSDEELMQTIVWKLGFPIEPPRDHHEKFWRKYESLWALTQASGVGDSDKFIEAAGPFFTELEGVLLDSLAFASWALLSDHASHEHPFSYDDSTDRRAGLESMQAIAGSAERTVDYPGGRVDLYHLMSSFAALAGKLESVVANGADYARPEAEFPEWAGSTELKSFALRSTALFLDLTAPSRQRILEGLREVSRLMIRAEVHQVRNEHAHYRRTGPSISRIESALEACRQAITRIESLGFCQMVFVPAEVTMDEWGRSKHRFTAPRSYEHTFVRPTRFDWMSLPELGLPMYVVRSAVIGDSSEVVRFTRRFDSQFAQMWSAYPVRRKQRALDVSRSGRHSEAAEIRP